MVKFRYIIHKETGTVIKYEDWKEAAERDNFIIVKGAEVFVNPKNIVKAREMLFSDDFEIIYDSEFTENELKALLEGMKVYSCEYGGYYDIIEKLNNKINTELRCKE